MMQYSVSDFLLDIVQNSIEAKSSVVMVDFLEVDGFVKIMVGDNGRGMDTETLKKVKDPFFTDGTKHENRRVGLGIPFLLQSVEMTGGEFDIKSEPEYGTSVYFTFDTNNVDCPPIGDLPSLFRSLMMFEGDYDILINRKISDRGYSVSRAELIEALGELISTNSLKHLKEFFLSQEEELKKES